jgi:hypothetical protein
MRKRAMRRAKLIESCIVSASSPACVSPTSARAQATTLYGLRAVSALQLTCANGTGDLMRAFSALCDLGEKVELHRRLYGASPPEAC